MAAVTCYDMPVHDYAVYCKAGNMSCIKCRNNENHKRDEEFKIKICSIELIK